VNTPEGRLLRCAGTDECADGQREDTEHQMAEYLGVAAHPHIAAVIGELVGMAAEQGGHLSLNRRDSGADAPLRKTSVSESTRSLAAKVGKR
jgi:hypothetical protein